MSLKAFTEMLSIKKFRESRAEMAVQKQRHVLQAALVRRDEDKKTLDDYRIQALESERGLYADLCRRIVRLHDIENVQQEVVILRSTERHYEQVLDDAETALVKEQQALDERRTEHREADRMKQKFIELVQSYAEERVKEIEQKEEAELEEVAETRRDRADWDEHHEEEAA